MNLKYFLTAFLIAVFSTFAYSQDLMPKKDASTGKWGYANTQGQWIIQPQFEEADSFYNGKAKVCKDQKYGVIRTDGKYALKLKYPLMYAYKGAYLVPDALIGDKGYWYFYREQPGKDKLKKTSLCECELKEVPGGGHIIMGEDMSFGGGPWGIYFDPDGPIYEVGFSSYNSTFDELSFKYANGRNKTYNLAELRRKEAEEQWKKISRGADYSLPIRNSYSSDVIGYFFSKDGITEKALADGTRTGQTIKADSVLRTDYSNVYFIVSGGKYGIMYDDSENGNSLQTLMPCEADSIRRVKRGESDTDYYYAYKNGKCGVWDLGRKKQFFPCDFDKLVLSTTSSDWYAKKGGKWGAYNYEGKCVVPLIYDGIAVDERGWSVKKNGKWGIIGADGKTILPFIFGDIWSVRSSGLTGYFSSSRQTPLYFFKDKESQEESSGIVNRHGKVIYRWNNGTSVFERFYNGYLIVKKGNKYGAIWCDTGRLAIPYIMDDVPGEDDFTGSRGDRIMMYKGRGNSLTIYVYSTNGKLVTSKVFTRSNLNTYTMMQFARQYLMH